MYYDKLQQSLFKLPNRSYPSLTPPTNFEKQIQNYHDKYRKALPHLIELYPDYKLGIIKPDKYTEQITIINHADDQIKEIENNISKHIKKNAISMKEQDKELDRLRKAYTTLENYTHGVGDMDNTSYQMLKDYELIYKHERIVFWLYVVFIIVFTYLCVLSSENKGYSFLIVISTVIVLYIVRYLYKKWVEWTSMPAGPTQVKTVEAEYPENEPSPVPCNSKDCCGEGTEWDEPTQRCLATTL